VRLDFDRERNLLRLSLTEEPARAAALEHAPGLIDMAAGGRLIGVELQLPASLTEQALAAWTSAGALEVAWSSAYFQLTIGPDDDAARSTAVELLVELDDAGAMLALGIPRRGAGYEISYPSGNR
jgi:hypothetical protein